MLNRVTLMGRLVADPELRSTASNLSVCSFRIAVDRDYKKGDQKETDFIDIVAWRSTAEFVANYFKKGRVIAVDGRLQIRPWEDKDGNKRFATEVVADNVYFGDQPEWPEQPDGIPRLRRGLRRISGTGWQLWWMPSLWRLSSGKPAGAIPPG